MRGPARSERVWYSRCTCWHVRCSYVAIGPKGGCHMSPGAQLCRGGSRSRSGRVSISGRSHVAAELRPLASSLAADPFPERQLRVLLARPRVAGRLRRTPVLLALPVHVGRCCPPAALPVHVGRCCAAWSLALGLPSRSTLADVAPRFGPPATLLVRVLSLHSLGPRCPCSFAAACTLIAPTSVLRFAYKEPGQGLLSTISQTMFCGPCGLVFKHQ